MRALPRRHATNEAAEGQEPRTETAEPTPRPATAHAPDPTAPTRARWQEILRVQWRLVTAFAVLVAGVVFVLLGWYGAAHTNVFTEQIPYLISGGLLGLGLIIVAGILASSATAERAMQDLRRELRASAPAGPAANGATPGGPSIGGRAQAGPNGRVYAVAGGRSFHVAGCPIVEGKENVREMEPAQAAHFGLTVCKLCGPD